MQKFALKHGKFDAITRTWNLPTERPKGIIVEFQDGRELPIQKIYHVGGRAKCFKVLIADFEGENLRRQLKDLQHDYSVSESENKTLTKDLENYQEIAPTPSEIKEKLEELENEADNVQSSIENFEYKLGIKTKYRQTYDRIDELAEILEDKIRELENEKEFLEDEISGLKLDNKALAWQIEELEKWKENTLKNEETTLN